MKSKKLDIKLLRERFISNYCRKMGWNPNKLSPSQLVEIIENPEFKAFRNSK
jgi:hypothetical protein